MVDTNASPSTELTRRERRRLEIRSRILKAATRLFYAQGFQATTVIELAERADVAKKTLFNHFPTKQHVLNALAMKVFEDLLVDLETARKAEPRTRERIMAFFGRLDRLAAQTGPMASEMAMAFLQATREAGFQRDESDRFQGALLEIVRDGVARGEVTSRHAPETLADMISAVYTSLIMSWSQDPDFPVKRKAREAAAFVADAIERRSEED